MFILGIITLSLEFMASIGVCLIYKFGNNIDGLVLALWSLPLIVMAIMTLVGGLVKIHKPEKRKKTIATTILGGAAIFGFLLYAIHLGFFIGTGHLIFYYIIYGF